MSSISPDIEQWLLMDEKVISIYIDDRSHLSISWSGCQKVEITGLETGTVGIHPGHRVLQRRTRVGSFQETAGQQREGQAGAPPQDLERESTSELQCRGPQVSPFSRGEKETGVLSFQLTCCCFRDCLTCGCGSTSSPTRPRVSPGSPLPVRASVGPGGANTCTATSQAAPSHRTQSRTTPCHTPPPPADPPPSSATTPAPAQPLRSPPGGCASHPTGRPRLSSLQLPSQVSSRLSTDPTSWDSVTPGEDRGGTARVRSPVCGTFPRLQSGGTSR